MDSPSYDKLLTLFDSAEAVLASNAGNLNAADSRIACLVNITAKETRRALQEAGAMNRAFSGMSVIAKGN